MAGSHKRKRSLQQRIESASLGNLTENQVDAGENVLSSTGEAKLTDEVQIKKEVAKAIPGSEENMEDSPVRGLMTGPKKMKSDPGLAEDIKSIGAPSESTIKKAVWDRASYLTEPAQLNVTLAGVRRLLEEDLELEKHALDPFKKFINQQVEQVMVSPDAPEKTTSQKKTNIKKHASGKASSVEEDARPSSKSNRDEVEEDEVKVKKKSSPKGKLQKSDAIHTPESQRGPPGSSSGGATASPRPLLYVDALESRRKQREDNVRHYRVEVPTSPSSTTRRGRRWCILKEACPGGPTDPTVLSSYTGHILYAISESASNDRDTLDHYSQTKRVRTMLLDCWPLECGSDLSKWLDKSQLMQLTSCMFEQYDMPLISAFVDRWQPDTNTFHLPFGEMSILLHDVQYILGLKIDGKAVHTGNLMSGEEVSVFLEVEKGFDVFESPYLWKGKDLGPVLDKGDILPQALMDMRRSKTVVDQYVAYLTLLTGFTLFTGKRRNRIPYEHMKLFKDLDEVEEYSWGSATLAWLYREMGKATRSKTKGISACLTLLQAWIYMYFPIFRPSPRGQPVQVGEPYSLMFKNNVKHDTKKDSYNAYRQRIDQLTSALVMWQPYNTGCVIPEMSRYSGVFRFMDVVEAYHPERCLRQFGYVQNIPAWPLHQPIIAVRSWNIQGYKVVHATSLSSWEMRHSSLLNLERLSVRVEDKNDPDVVRGYDTWYQKISHPIFYYGDIPDTVANFDVIGFAQMAVPLKDLVMSMCTQPTKEERIQMFLDCNETMLGLATQMNKVQLTSRGYLTRRD